MKNDVAVVPRGSVGIMAAMLCTLVVMLALPLTPFVSADVIVTTKTGQLRLQSLEASFGPALPSEGATGMLVIGSPLDGCAAMKPALANLTQIVLIQRSPASTEGGGRVGASCEFVDKVRNAQDAGYSGVIVYDNVEELLVVMAGNGEGIRIPSVFVSLESGEILHQHEYNAVLMLPTPTPTWPSFLITFIIVLSTTIFCAGLYIHFRFRARRLANGSSSAPHRTLMTRTQIRNLPTRKFKQEDAEESCCICLAEYEPGDSITTLPCNHEFHKACIAPWLQERQRSCPLCKCDPLNADRTPLIRAQNGPRAPRNATSNNPDASPSSSGDGDGDGDEGASRGMGRLQQKQQQQQRVGSIGSRTLPCGCRRHQSYGSIAPSSNHNHNHNHNNSSSSSCCHAGNQGRHAADQAGHDVVEMGVEAEHVGSICASGRNSATINSSDFVVNITPETVVGGRGSDCDDDDEVDVDGVDDDDNTPLLLKK